MCSLTFAALAAPSYPAGIEVHTSECASGGFDYFFFENGSVVAKCWGCESQPHVQAGTWEREGQSVRVRMNQEWLGKGHGRIVEAASVHVFESYVGEHRTGSFDTDVSVFEPAYFASTMDGCEYAVRQNRSADPHSFLRLFEGDHPETYQRSLTATELERESVDQLRLMRNEVFARYGYRFKDANVLAFFSKIREYRPTLTNVDAFLSDIERENVARLLAAERARDAAPPPPRR